MSDRLVLEVEAVTDFEPALKDCNCESVGTLEVALASEVPNCEGFIMPEEAKEVVATPEETVPTEDRAVMDIEADADEVATSPPECRERLLATWAAIWAIPCVWILSPTTVAVPELAGTLLESVALLLLLRLIVLLAIMFPAEVAPVGPVNISVPSTKRSSAASADTTWPFMEIPAEPGLTVVLFRIGFAGFTTKIWPAMVMVDSGGGAEIKDGVAYVTGKAIMARLESRIKSVILMTRE